MKYIGSERGKTAIVFDDIELVFLKQLVEHLYSNEMTSQMIIDRGERNTEYLTSTNGQLVFNQFKTLLFEVEDDDSLDREVFFLNGRNNGLE